MFAQIYLKKAFPHQELIKMVCDLFAITDDKVLIYQSFDEASKFWNENYNPEIKMLLVIYELQHDCPICLEIQPIHLETWMYDPHPEENFKLAIRVCEALGCELLIKDWSDHPWLYIEISGKNKYRLILVDSDDEEGLKIMRTCGYTLGDNILWIPLGLTQEFREY